LGGEVMKKIYAIIIILIITINPFVVIAETSLTEDDFDLGTIIITPHNKDNYSSGSYGNISIIGAENIQECSEQGVYNLLSEIPGVYTTDYTSTGKSANVDIWGFGDTASRNVLVMIDGRRINEIDISSIDWRQIPIENIKRIEVMKGMGTVLYGDNASAGVINIITKKTDEADKFYIATQMGSYAFRKYYAGLNDSYKIFDYNIFYNNEETKGYRTNGDYQGKDLQVNLAINKDEKAEFNIAAGYHDDDFGLPGGLNISEIDNLGRKATTTPNDKGNTRSYYYKFTPALHLSNQDILLDVWTNNRKVNSYVHYEVAKEQIRQSDASQIDSYGASVKYINKYSLNYIDNQIILGGDIFKARNALNSQTPAFDIYNSLKIFKDTFSIFISDEISLNDTVFLGGGYRNEKAYYTFDQPDLNSYETNNINAEAYEFNIKYNVSKNNHFQGNFSHGYRFPATDEFYSRWSGLSTDLKPQKSDTWQLSFSNESLKYITPAINFFLMETQDEIFYDPTLGLFGENSNYDQIKRKGAELSFNFKPTDYLSARAGYTYLKANFENGNFKDNKVPMVPNNKATLYIILNVTDNISLVYDGEYAGSQYPINDQVNEQPKLKAHFVNNIKISISRNGWDIFFKTNNIFNKKYASIAVANTAGTTVDYYPAPERNYIFGLSKKF
jgi:iron complex outermembrane receptor protein